MVKCSQALGMPVDDITLAQLGGDGCHLECESDIKKGKLINIREGLTCGSSSHVKRCHQGECHSATADYGKLTIKIINGFIPDEDCCSHSDGRVNVKLNNTWLGKTPTHDDTLHPEWNYLMQAEDHIHRDTVIWFDVWDWDPTYDDWLGSVSESINQLMLRGYGNGLNHKLYFKDKKYWINVSVQFHFDQYEDSNH